MKTMVSMVVSVLVAGCSGASGDGSGAVSSAVGAEVTETVWTAIHNERPTGVTTGTYVRCELNSDCPSLCCVGAPICETCTNGLAVCVPAALCQGG